MNNSSLEALEREDIESIIHAIESSKTELELLRDLGLRNAARIINSPDNTPLNNNMRLLKEVTFIGSDSLDITNGTQCFRIINQFYEISVQIFKNQHYFFRNEEVCMLLDGMLEDLKTVFCATRAAPILFPKHMINIPNLLSNVFRLHSLIGRSYNLALSEDP